MQLVGKSSSENRWKISGKPFTPEFQNSQKCFSPKIPEKASLRKNCYSSFKSSFHSPTPPSPAAAGFGVLNISSALLLLVGIDVGLHLGKRLNRSYFIYTFKMRGERSWMYDRWSEDPESGLKNDYMNGVDDFLRFASAHARTPGFVRCPCTACKNKQYHDLDEVKHHLFRSGFLPGYYRWVCHGESSVPRNVGDEIPNQPSRPEVTASQRKTGADCFVDMVYDVAGPSFNVPEPELLHEEPNPKSQAFLDLLKKAEKPIFEGSKDSALSITMKLLTLKSTYNGSQAMFNDMLNIWLPNIPKGHGIPTNFYEAKKLVGGLGLPHVKIDVCPKGCMLFWKEASDSNECDFCKHPRWEARPHTTSSRGKNVPFQRLHYLPLIPRLQRLYVSDETAKHMTWLHYLHFISGYRPVAFDVTKIT